MENHVGVSEVSDYLAVKPKTVYQWAELGYIPSYMFKGCLRFNMAEIRQWVESCKREVQPGYNQIAQTIRCPKKGGK